MSFLFPTIPPPDWEDRQDRYPLFPQHGVSSVRPNTFCKGLARSLDSLASLSNPSSCSCGRVHLLRSLRESHENETWISWCWEAARTRAWVYFGAGCLAARRVAPRTWLRVACCSLTRHVHSAQASWSPGTSRPCCAPSSRQTRSWS